MEINISLDVKSLIQASVSAERIQPILDKAIAEAIKDAISSATGYNSAFRKMLQQQVAETMPHGLEIDDCAKFQQMFNLAITEAVQGENAAAIRAAMVTAVKSVVPDVPSRIKLSELMEEARSGFHKESHECFYAHLELSEFGGGRLYLDSDERKHEKYRAEHCIAFTKAGEVYSVRLDGKDITPKSLPNAVGSFDGLLLSMYVGRTSIEVDMDEYDVESAAQSKEDY